jgi:hypothetical protein
MYEFFLINIASIVKAVKEKKEYQSQLFDKVDFICREFGTKCNNDGITTYIYEGDNLRFALNEGQLLNKDYFKHAMVQTLDNTDFFLILRILLKEKKV